MRFIIRRNKRRNYIVARFFCLRFCQSCSSGIQTRKLHNACAENSRIRPLRSGKYLCQCTSFQIRRRSHR